MPEIDAYIPIELEQELLAGPETCCDDNTKGQKSGTANRKLEKAMKKAYKAQLMYEAALETVDSQLQQEESKKRAKKQQEKKKTTSKKQKQHEQKKRNEEANDSSTSSSSSNSSESGTDGSAEEANFDHEHFARFFEPRTMRGGARSFDPRMMMGGARSFDPRMMMGGARSFDPRMMMGGARFFGHGMRGAGARRPNFENFSRRSMHEGFPGFMDPRMRMMGGCPHFSGPRRVGACRRGGFGRRGH